MKRFAYACLALLTISAAGCDALKEAMTAHVDVAAKAGSAELPVDTLAKMMGQLPPQVTLQKDVAKLIANVWVDYQLLGMAAAREDSLDDRKLVDAALWLQRDGIRRTKLHDTLVKTWSLPDTSTLSEAQYAQGDLLAASHILFQVQPNFTEKQVDSMRRIADRVRAQATPANFAALAEKNSMDPYAKGRGGSLGVFAKEQMVPPFSMAVIALKPGEISKDLVRTEHGFHIIRRSQLSEVRSEFASRWLLQATTIADTAYLSKIEREAKVEVKEKAAEIVKAVATDLDAHRTDRAVVATSSRGSLTAADVARYIRGLGQPQQLSQQIKSAPDSAIRTFVQSLMRQELVLREADKYKITVDSASADSLRMGFKQMVIGSWRRLNLDPASLKDSAKSTGDREKLTAGRVNEYVTALIGGRAQFVQIDDQLQTVLRGKYKSKINDAGLERALEGAPKFRTDTGNSAVPMPPPGDGRGGPPPGPGGPPPARGTPPPPGR